MAEKYHCNDCDEDVMVSNVHLKLPICSTCGMGLTKVPTVQREAAEAANNHDSLAGLFELLGADLREAMMDAMNASQPARQISVSYLNTLGKVIVDDRKTILKDISLHIGPLSLLAVSAYFGHIPEDTMTYAGNIVCAAPVYGESALTNPGQCEGALVLLERGEVSFASKAVRAMQAGAAAVIVAQTVGVWPFVMADSANELQQAGIELTIPVVMISQKDAVVVKKFIADRTSSSSATSATSTTSSSGGMTSAVMGGSADSAANTAQLETSLRFGHSVQECSICQECFDVGHSVLKLPCRHLYHTECVTNWLQVNNTCPLCRLELPKEVEGRTVKRLVDRTVDNNPSSLYFN